MRQLTCVEITEQGLMARYVAGRLADDEVEALESHYLTCARCYDELRFAVAMRELLPAVAGVGTPHPRALTLGPERRQAGGRARRRLTAGAIVALAAAAVLTLVVWRPGQLTRPPVPTHRDEVPGATAVPVPAAPVGAVAAAREFRWSPVTGADRYRVTLYDEAGAVVWERETSESRVTLPEETRLEPGAPYLWEVAARVDWNRWVRSAMAQFQIRQR